VREHYRKREDSLVIPGKEGPMNGYILYYPGQVTYEYITCPTCGAYLKVGYQSLPPEQLIADAPCPVCGTIVAHNVVSVEQVTTGGFDWNMLVQMIFMLAAVAMVMGFVKMK